MSMYYDDYKKDDCDCYDKKYDNYDYDKKKKKDCRAILECGRGVFRTLPKSEFDALNPGTNDKPVPLAEVTIDTRTLSEPCVKIEYSSMINVELAPDSSLQLTFQLVRKCRCEDEEMLRTWIYERTTDAAALTTEDTFTVTFCECFDNACCDEKDGKCCTYTIQLVQATSGNSSGTPLEGTYNITEKDISAIATCSSCIH